MLRRRNSSFGLASVNQTPFALTTATTILLFSLIGPVSSCPDGCACVINDHVICNSGGLSSIPSNIPSATQYISLNDNPIQNLSSDSFRGLPQLKFIYIEKSNISQISPYAFRGLPVNYMEEIALLKNPLDHLASYSLASLKGVSRIDLSYNRISVIQANAFHGCENVREISLIGNPLKVIESNAFTNLNHVQFFHLPKGISVIEKDAFNGLQHVQMLRLDNMTANELGPFTFRGLTNVGSLEIRGSHVGVIRKNAFSGLKIVDHLGIDHCSLEKVEKDAFVGLQNVSDFFINANVIDSVENHAFWGLETTKDQAIKRLNFTENHIPCDCQLHYVVENFEKSAPDFISHNYCHFPKETKGLLVSHIQLELLDECPSETPVIQPSIIDHSQPEEEEEEEEEGNPDFHHSINKKMFGAGHF
ncbi:hypothetical protein CHUAL_005826 [Chamberlinius hualienensis]